MANDRQLSFGGKGGGATDDARPSARHPVCEGANGETVGEGAAGCEAGLQPGFQKGNVCGVCCCGTATRTAEPRNGLLFAKGFNDQILLRDGQLERWLNYLKDNPRCLLLKRENPDLFRVQRGLTFAGLSFSAIGNRFLLERPLKIQVQCSRSISEEELKMKTNECLRAARQGAVLVSPAISNGEKTIMRAAFEEGLPLIYLQENGFTPNRSLGPISSGDVKVFSCSPESKECLPLIYGSHKT